MSESNFNVEKIKQIVLDAVQSPEEVQNDSGRVESRPLDELVEALEFLSKLDSGESPFKRLRQIGMRLKDVWR